MNGRAWTMQSEAELRLLLNSKLTYEEIGIKLNRTTISIQKKVSKLGLTGERVHAPKTQKAKDKISKSKTGKKGHTPWNKGKKGYSIRRRSYAGDKSPTWRGGVKTRSDGYRYIHKPDHPFTNGCYVMEHRLVMEGILGRYLNPEEVVHHINGDRQDNRPENLQLFKNGGEHTKHHMELRRMKKIAQ